MFTSEKNDFYKAMRFRIFDVRHIHYLMNKDMKKALLSIILLITINAFSQTSELKLASDIWPPFTDVEGEKSFALDLVKEALARTGVMANFEILELNDIITGIDAGKYDGSAALWLSEDRENKNLFSEPYLQNQLVLVGQKGSDVSSISFK